MSKRPSGPERHAWDRVDEWAEGWRAHGRIVVLLDFDGTLAPIVDRPELAEMPDTTRSVLRKLINCAGAYVAIISGRWLADARERAALEGITYAGNHGMEIEGPGLHRVNPRSAAARPRLAEVLEEIGPPLTRVPGAIVEDKGLTLSIHYRLVVRALVERVRSIVEEAVDHAGGALRITEGKEVLEVRPDVDWNKGSAVDFLLEAIAPPAGAPILYVGDDRTDEDAFRAVRQRPGGAGVVVADPPPPESAATAYLRSTEEVARLLDLLVQRAPS